MTQSIESPLSVDQARYRLQEGLAARGAVRGRLSGDQLMLVATHFGLGNGARPVLRGRLVATGPGSRLDYRLGWNRVFAAVATAWAGVVAAMLLYGTGLTIVRLVTGGAAGGPAVLAAVALGMLLFVGGLIAGGRYLSRDEAPMLRAWLEERLRP
ncbi:hypothetical protein KZZ52_24800 [Dactylosporangium sp. AC04546]|uniref:hypothetical protein n=1 Tax=Dactylosporangium sp. AC04546 TaxID=2862460 RepID=UPI001EE045F6|nr:hypothetical protein [Dactylosporangium sp. AC04546]WVK88492.1 hypothetical protein KZZ52_24800 [Dactylosporangium sp. AC04546]